MKNPGRVWRNRGFLLHEFRDDGAANIFSALCIPSQAPPSWSAHRGDKSHINVGRVRR